MNQPNSEKWQRHFLRLAETHLEMSKDPNTKVGAVIVGPNREVLSMGFNGLPVGISDMPIRLNNRERKLELIVHAEMNAILLAARRGVALEGSTMFMAAHNAENKAYWGGAPCLRCTVELIQAGIQRIVTYPFKDTPSKWLANVTKARKILAEASIDYIEIER